MGDAADPLRLHWPEYLIEAMGLGVFMIMAGLCVMLLEHPRSPLAHAIPGADLRRALIGVTMGLTAIEIIYSPWGRAVWRSLEPRGNTDLPAIGKDLAG